MNETQDCLLCGLELPHEAYDLRSPEEPRIRSVCRACEAGETFLTPMQVLDLETHERALKRKLGRILSTTKDSAKRRGYKCDIELTLLFKLWNDQEGTCCRTGFSMSLGTGTAKNKNLLAPSLDRIDNYQGYHDDNVQLVCVAYNLMKNRQTDAQTLVLSQAIVDTAENNQGD